MKETTHKYAYSHQKGNTYTIKGLCGYFETYDFDDHKKIDTPFIGYNDFTCEDCKAEYALKLLADLP